MEDRACSGVALPDVRVRPPGPRSQEMAGRLGQVEAPSSSTIHAGKVPVFWDEGQGANIVDVDGNLYVDLTGGFCTAAAGHSNPRIADAVARQAAHLMHSQGALNPNPRRLELAERLAGLAPGDLSVSHICNTGAEAVEMGIKTARLYTGRKTILAFHHGFHGKTLGALSVTARNYYREPFLPLVPQVVHVPYAYCYRCPFGHERDTCDIFCAKFVEYTLDDADSGVADVAAIVVEVIQGHGGWVVPPVEFIQALRRISRERGILLIADEIITGFGRTGNWFACEHFCITPDIMALGKAMASGFPISAMMTTPEIAAAWKPLQHTSTFLGHPVGCAAALASISEIESRNLVQRSADLGAWFRTSLAALAERHPLIGDIRGVGLMVGMELVRDRNTKEIAEKETGELSQGVLRRGFMVQHGGSYGNVLKLSPPLVITQEQLEAAVKAIDQALAEVETGHGR